MRNKNRPSLGQVIADPTGTGELREQTKLLREQNELLRRQISLLERLVTPPE